MLQILIIDDHEVDRILLQKFLSGQPDLKIVGIGEEAYDACMMLNTIKPDIIILDLERGHFAGTEIIPLLKQKSPESSIIYFTHKEDEASIRRAIANGIAGYLLKFNDLDKLPYCIREIYRGFSYMSPKIASKVLKICSDLINHQNQGKKGGDLQESAEILPSTISKTELNIISYIAQGRSTREIAEILNLKLGTVRNYISSTMQKAGLRSRTQIAMYALHHGLNSLLEEKKKRRKGRGDTEIERQP
ncbi:MAG: response regulator transcription factor [Treponema sp.]|jgi:DNA-binding NarL/FixJ family response regulator|nr:response regulator transcription factor [Treponema sp.]